MLDVPALQRLEAHHHPEWPRQSPAEALVSLHIARVESRAIPRKLKTYSRDWLKERGLEKIDNRWTAGPPSPVVAEAVGIASQSKVPGLARRIVRAMGDALDEARAKGIIEPPMQRERMLKARARVRFKGRHL